MIQREDKEFIVRVGHTDYEAVSINRGTTIVTPEYYNPEYRYPQNSSPDFGEPKSLPRVATCLHRHVAARMKRHHHCFQGPSANLGLKYMDYGPAFCAMYSPPSVDRI